MNWEAVGAIGEIVGALAVVITIIYLSLQIRTNTRTTRAAVFQELSDSEFSLRLMGIENPDVQRLWLQLQAGDSLTDVEYERASEYQAALIDWHQNNFFQRNRGFLDNEYFVSMSNYLKVALGTPSSLEWWDQHKEFYRKDFVTYVDRFLEEPSGLRGPVSSRRHTSDA